jgi:hypothetical protein
VGRAGRGGALAGLLAGPGRKPKKEINTLFFFFSSFSKPFSKRFLNPI